MREIIKKEKANPSLFKNHYEKSFITEKKMNLKKPSSSQGKNSNSTQVDIYILS